MFKKGSKKPAHKEADDDLDGLGLINPDDLENDPELMRELAMMQRELSGPKKAPAPQANAAPAPRPRAPPKEVDLTSAQSFITGGDEDINVELTEEDMNDPELLAQLTSLSGDGEPMETGEPEAPYRNEEPPVVARPASVTAQRPSPQSQPQSQPQPQLQLQPQPQPRPQTQTQTQTQTQPQPQPQPRPQTQSKPSPAPQPEAPLAQDLTLDQKLKSTNPKILEKYIQEEKAKALQAKKSDDTALAIELMRGMKQLQARLQEVNNPGAAQAASASAAAAAKGKPAPAAQKKAVPVTVTNASAYKIATGEQSGDLSQTQGASLQFLENALLKQIEACKQAEIRYQLAGDKAPALAFHKEMQNFTADLQALRGIMAAKGGIPRFHSEMKTFSYVNQFLELQENEMELQVVRCFHVPIPQDYTSVDSYLRYELPYPSDEEMQSGTSSTVKNTTDPVFNFSAKLRIQRNKALARFIEKKKITVELMHHRGFFRKAVSLGRITLELAPLLTHCEVHEIADLLNEKRKPTGAKVELRLRLRYPVTSAEHVTTSEKWLYIDSFDGGSGSNPQAKPGDIPASSPEPTPSKAKKAASESSEDVKPSKPKEPKEPKETSEPKEAKTPKEPKESKEPKTSRPKDPEPQAEDDDDEDPDSVSTMVSNMVLEAAQKQAEEKIASLRAKKLPVPEELTDRLQQINLKINLLIIQVQTGQLSMEAYLDVLRKGINDEKERALRLKKAGKLEGAKVALARMKIMKDELQEAEGAQ